MDAKSKFNSELKKNREKLAKNASCLTDEQYNNIIRQIIELKRGVKKKEPRDFQLLKRFDVILVQDKHKLIVPMKDKSVVLYYVSDGKLYDLLKSTHVSIGHGGRDRMIKELSKKYKNISRSDICTFLQMCEACQEKQKSIKKATVVKPIICSEFNSRCQVDLIEFQMFSNEKFKYIMIYQDYLTKFVVLRPLEHKLIEEVAYNLIDIFTLLGAPCIIQSAHGRDFSNDIVNCLRSLWPELKIVHGKPNHSQENEEQVKQDIKSMLITWMQDQKSSHWSEGLRFIQLTKNRTYNSGLKMTPHEALFGTELKIGLSEKISDNFALNIDSEEDLREFMEKSEDINTKQNLSNSNAGNEVIIQLNNENLNDSDKIAKENFKSHAKEIKKKLDKNFFPVEIGAVRHPVLENNKEHGDSKNIFPVIELTTDGYYKAGTQNGILKQPYAKSVVSVCQKMLININEKLEKEMALGTLLNEQSISSVQAHTNGNDKIKKAQEMYIKHQNKEKARMIQFRNETEKKVTSFVQDDHQTRLKFPTLNKVLRNIVHEIAEDAGMLAYSFGEEEVDRYIMIFKKDFPPSEDELNALRNGQEWNDDIAKRLSEQREQVKIEEMLDEKKRMMLKRTNQDKPKYNYKEKFQHLVGLEAAEQAARKTETNKSYGFVPSENKKDLRSIEQTLADIREKKRLKIENDNSQSQSSRTN
ncbi:SCAN domain-containing protein 3 isoform X1 [Rhopalosiphum maidis]|uniref:SCAN domain-containing protein 3 isoform X1 n=2 Tax=Rhopalosiphum maidis TaxID=43146 RepID=UPI000EFF1345|nr:SCAN domain-containing protein 3 isoform X1 [Rhopalosiphum maidis]